MKKDTSLQNENIASVASIRRNYAKDHLDEKTSGDDPILLFQEWFNETANSDILDPTAFTLSTIGSDNRPDSRIVLLKGFSKDGFIFYSNYKSKKGQDIDHNPYCTMLFFWSEFERQIRIHGKINKITKAESEKYFHSRPRDAQIGSWASDQSKPIRDREALDSKLENFKDKFAEGDIPIPDHWGGYAIQPDYFEFWQGRPGRLHDRISFSLKNSNWIRQRLEP